jgi:hypothetical protein
VVTSDRTTDVSSTSYMAVVAQRLDRVVEGAERRLDVVAAHDLVGVGVGEAEDGVVGEVLGGSR